MTIDHSLVDACHAQRVRYVDIVRAWVESGLELTNSPNPITMAVYRMRTAQVRRAEADITKADTALLAAYNLETADHIKSHVAQAVMEANKS